MRQDERRGLSPSGRAAIFAFLLLVLFTGVIPIYMDMRQMPHGASAAPPAKTPSISAWAVWPATPPFRRIEPSSVTTAYGQMAVFANRSAFAQAKLEQIQQEQANGRATSVDTYHAARSVSEAAADERDALMGLVLPPEARALPAFTRAWKDAQLAAISKVRASDLLAANVSAWQPGAKAAYDEAIASARAYSRSALQQLQTL